MPIYPSCRFILRPAEASEYGKRREAKRRESNKWCIEGEYLTTADIAVRKGWVAATVRVKLAKLRKLPGPITWKAIDEMSAAWIKKEQS